MHEVCGNSLSGPRRINYLECRRLQEFCGTTGHTTNDGATFQLKLILSTLAQDSWATGIECRFRAKPDLNQVHRRLPDLHWISVQLSRSFVIQRRLSDRGTPQSASVPNAARLTEGGCQSSPRTAARQISGFPMRTAAEAPICSNSAASMRSRSSSDQKSFPRIISTF